MRRFCRSFFPSFPAISPEVQPLDTSANTFASHSGLDVLKPGELRGWMSGRPATSLILSGLLRDSPASCVSGMGIEHSSTLLMPGSRKIRHIDSHDIRSTYESHVSRRIHDHTLGLGFRAQG